MNVVKYEDDPYGPTQPAAFGDLPSGLTIAGSIAAALLHRERTGEAAVVDVSLLAFGMWVNSPDIVISKLFGQAPPRMTRDRLPNPLVNRYLTKDGRLIQLVMLQGVRFWPEFITAVGRADLANRRALHIAGGVVRQPRGRDAHPRRDLRHSHVLRMEGRPRRCEGRVVAGADRPRPV